MVGWKRSIGCTIILVSTKGIIDVHDILWPCIISDLWKKEELTWSELTYRSTRMLTCVLVSFMFFPRYCTNYAVNVFEHEYFSRLLTNFLFIDQGYKKKSYQIPLWFSSSSDSFISFYPPWDVPDTHLYWTRKEYKGQVWSSKCRKVMG